MPFSKSAAMVCLAPIVLLLASSSLCSAGMIGRKLQTVPIGNDPVDLGAATKFTVLAATTVTNSGVSPVDGFLGVSPGNAVADPNYEIEYTDANVFGPSCNDDDAKAAHAAAALAYTDAKGRVFNAITIPQVNIGGETYGPGLYTTPGALAISSGSLTLDAKGNTDGVFIFQMETTFLMSTGLKMILTIGARAKNIFWVIGSSATFEVKAEAYGTFLAFQSISVNTGATFTGRLIAINAAVTMLANTVVFPSDGLPL
uniref:Ice-binding protein isoform 6 n=1 Tax=Chlamydomonas sp. ICE-MDV TaxID=1983280 RepID=A0A1W6JGL1_9CHLO|nr:ice-binding protein isoform 6 [Chlamydomonas sp. ICE-MDV]